MHAQANNVELIVPSSSTLNLKGSVRSRTKKEEKIQQAVVRLQQRLHSIGLPLTGHKLDYRYCMTAQRFFMQLVWD